VNTDSRMKNTIRNIIFSVGGQVFNIIITFISRTIFIKILGSTYLGVQGLFTNILSILALSELGIGIAITYLLYKPIAEKDEKQISALMNFCSKIYWGIGIFVFVVGLSILPFLDIFIKGNQEIQFLNLIFILFISNSALSYFFSYKRTLILADQRAYINTLNINISNFIQNILQIIILVLTENFILYLIIQIAVTFISNLFISKKVDKYYPFLKRNKEIRLDKKARKELFINVKAMMYHRVGAAVVNGTDNILISAFVGIEVVGLYANYRMIINTIRQVITQIYNSVSASVGSLTTKESADKTYETFNTLFFITFWISCFFSVAVLVMLQPFIILWLGHTFLLDGFTVIVVIICFYINIMRQSIQTLKIAWGMYQYDQYRPIYEAIINLVVSLILVNKIGLVGVFLGTLISSLLTYFWNEPYIVYKNGFNKKVRIYFQKYILYTNITIFIAILTNYVSSFIKDYTIGSLIIRGIICLIIPNGIIFLLFKNTKEMEYIIRLLSKVYKKILKAKRDTGQAT